MGNQKPYKVVVSKKARQMLIEHTKFLANVSIQAAKRLAISFRQSERELSSMPQRCPFFRESGFPENTYHSYLIEKRYLLIFKIEENTVYIEYILDCRQDYPWLLQ